MSFPTEGPDPGDGFEGLDLDARVCPVCLRELDASDEECPACREPAVLRMSLAATPLPAVPAHLREAVDDEQVGQQQLEEQPVDEAPPEPPPVGGPLYGGPVDA